MALAVLVALGLPAWRFDATTHRTTRREYAGIIAGARTAPTAPRPPF